MVDFAELIDPQLAAALSARGFTELTAVQLAVLEPELDGRDLRITSQTGSGKTVAIGLALRDVVKGGVTPERIAKPHALVVAPTRELAKQVEQELSWLFAPLNARVVSVTGGASYTDERRALGSGPSVIVGTPGRLLDHLERGAIDGSSLAAVVLDEADRLLDMGFRDDLEAIFRHAPEGRRTHLVSATFPPEVRQLADDVQNDPVHVEGTRLGAANADIEHVIHLVDPKQRVDALVNLLLADPEAQTLVFARTRADVAGITQELEHAGFSARSLSGEMQQRERNRALEAFRRGDLHVLVATDVAARGIDVQDIARVIHVEPPNDADTYTHRSGRTGRAGRKGTSIMLVPPPALSRAKRLLASLRIPFRFAPVPNAAEIRAARSERIFDELTGDDPPEFAGYDDSLWTLAKRVAAAPNLSRTVARLLARAKLGGVTDPREVRTIEPPEQAPRRREERGPREAGDGRWVPFKVSWGSDKGADARRLLAMVCRRGDIRGSDVGAIRIGRMHAIVDVKAEVADDFDRAASKPDPRDRLRIERDAGPPPRRAQPRAEERFRDDDGGGEEARGRERVGERERPAPRAYEERPHAKPAYAKSAPHKKAAERAHAPEKRAHAPEKRTHDRAEASEKPSYGKASYGKASYGKPAHEKPAHGKPSYGKPAHEKPAHGKPAHAKSDKGGQAAPKRKKH